MRNCFLAILYVFISICLSCEKQKVDNDSSKTVTLANDSATVGIFIVNAASNKFEEGKILKFPLAIGCDADSIPFKITNGSWDLYWMVYKYTPTDDTIFCASSIWQGIGYIMHPHSWDTSTSFIISNNIVTLTSPIQYFVPDYILYDSTSVEAQNHSWDAINNLSVVNTLCQHPYRVGFYYWAPQADGFGDNKWIVFLYRGNNF